MKQKTKERKRLLRFFEDSAVCWYDIVILLILMGFFFLSFEMRDLLHTAGCSYGYLDGHFFDFYDYLAEYGIAEDGTYGLHASYLPTIYLLFAIWNIPMKLLGRVPVASAQLTFFPMMYAKLLPCLVWLACGVVIYKISLLYGMRERKSKLCMYAFLSMPVGLYGQFILGQYESIMIFLVLLGYYYWLKKKDFKFIMFFALAVSVKYTALLVFLPLLVLREKKIFKMLLYFVLVLSVAGLEFLVYMHSPVFMAYAFGVGGSGDNPTGYINNAAYFTGFWRGGELKYVVYLSILFVILVLAFAYFRHTHDDKEERNFGLYYTGLVLAAFFCFSKWHPHWLMLLIPFFTIGAFLHRNTKGFMALELLFSLVFLAFCTCQFGGVADEVMLEKGIFKYMLPDGKISSYSTMADYLGILDMSVELTVMTALIAAFALLKHPKMLAEDPAVSEDHAVGWLRARYIIPMMLYLLVSLLVVKNTLNAPDPGYNEEARVIFVNLNEEGMVTQPLPEEVTSVGKLQFPVSRGEDFDPAAFYVRILDEDGAVLYETELYAEDYSEGEVVRLEPGVFLESGRMSVEFAAERPDKKAGFCLLAADSGAYQEAYSAGKDLGYHLDMVVFP